MRRYIYLSFLLTIKINGLSDDVFEGNLLDGIFLLATKVISCDAFSSSERWWVHTGLLETFGNVEIVFPVADSQGFVLFEVTEVDDPPVSDENANASFWTIDREYLDISPDTLESPSSQPERTVRCCLLILGSPYVQWQFCNSEIEMRTGTFFHAPSERCYPAMLLVEAKEMNSNWIMSSGLSVYPDELSAVTNENGARIGWRLGTNTKILDQTIPNHVLRKWDWKWSRTCGPVYFWIDVSRSQAELTQWYHGLKLIQYIDHMDCLYPDRIQSVHVAERYVKLEDGAYGLLNSNKLSRELYLKEGRVELLHGVGFKYEQLSCDATMLASILQGDLGDVSRWRLIDADWGNCEASGEGIDSLRKYLDPCVDRGTFDQKPFNLKSEH